MSHTKKNVPDSTSPQPSPTSPQSPATSHRPPATEHQPPATSHRLFYLKIGGLFLVAAILRFYLLTHQSLWSDEWISLQFATAESLFDMLNKLTMTRTSERFQPLYFLALYYWTGLFGISEYSLRFLSALCGFAALVPFYFLLRRLFDKRHVIWGLGFGACSAFLIYYSQEVRPYSLLILLCSLQLYAFLPVLQCSRPAAGWGKKTVFGLATGAALLGSIFFALFFTAQAICHLVLYRNPKEWLKWWIPALLFSLPALLFYAFSPVFEEPGKAVVQNLTQPLIHNVLFVPYGILVGTTFAAPLEALRGEDRLVTVLTYWPHLLVLLVTFCTLCIALLLLVSRAAPRLDKQQMRAHYFFLMLTAVSFLLSLLFAFSTDLNWLPRHSFFLVLPVAVVLSLTFNEDLKEFCNCNSMVYAARSLVVLLLFFNFYSLSNYYFDPSHARDDYRSVAGFLKEAPDIPTILLWGEPGLLEYYGSGPIIDGSAIPEQKLGAHLRKLSGDAPTIRVVIDRVFYWGERAALVEQLDQHYVTVDTVQFPYFHIFILNRKDNRFSGGRIHSHP